jgi:hypothetical protein
MRQPDARAPLRHPAVSVAEALCTSYRPRGGLAVLPRTAPDDYPVPVSLCRPTGSALPRRVRSGARFPVSQFRPPSQDLLSRVLDRLQRL